MHSLVSRAPAPALSQHLEQRGTRETCVEERKLDCVLFFEMPDPFDAFSGQARGAQHPSG